ncbi:sulfatase-like hydrolase/transferase [Anaeromyxobacter terrae]|uniref:sulfatase-like hydrolase/transferase n=1 Tax=Anaeromyxobacter terrae TaxID=2925406 RepID=UPI001F5A3203|nr:sulfatase-like hydrolase/transferase [Anaeromyxobacter sp. SG22]
MSRALDVGAGATRGGAGYRFPALVWSLLHVPLFLALYATSIAAAVRNAPAAYRAPLWPTFLPQAALLALGAFAVALPFSLRPRAYRFAAPAVLGLATSVVALDSRIFGAVGFHMNGFFVRVLFQPYALKETGVSPGDVAMFLALAALFVALDVAVGAWFIRRFATGRRAWTLALTLVLAAAAERVYGAGLVYLGGPAMFAASGVLPLQVPVRMGGIYSRLFGKRAVDQFAGQESLRLPAGIAPQEIRFTRRPDVLFIVAESLPATHLAPDVMPNLWRRSEAGARFTRHYAGAVATHYTIFSLLYGLQAQKLEATLGAGRRPVLFPALRENGYAVKALSASCLDWMDLRETVFAGVSAEDLKNRCDGEGWGDRDPQLLADARKMAEAVPREQPLFMFVFLYGTHFNYFYPPGQEPFRPAWDGAGGIKATTAPADQIRNRAKNAAYALDGTLEEFLSWFERTRGKKPLVLFTGDHGEEFREKGHLGHGSAVTNEQIHVPFVVLGEGIPAGVHDAPTSHVDFVPTIFSLLGDTHPPSLHSDGLSAFDSPDDRFVLSTVGWEPRYAVVGKDLKVTVFAGLAGASVTDPEDRPLPDGSARLAANAGKIMRAMRGEEVAPAHAARPLPASATAGEQRR